MQHHESYRSGLTLVEVIIATAVFLTAAVGILYSFAKCLELNELGRGTTVAIQSMKNKMETIKSSDFSQIYTTFNNTTFLITGLNGIGVVYVDNSNAHLLEVRVVFCWRLPNGRVIGEDLNLNGVLDTGEDKNGNGEIDSYAQMVTRIYG